MPDSFVTPWTVAHQAPLSMGFPRQEYWNVLPFPTPGNLLDPGIEPMSPAWQVDFLPLSYLGSPQRLLVMIKVTYEFSNMILWRISSAGLCDFSPTTLSRLKISEARASEAEKMTVG